MKPQPNASDPSTKSTPMIDLRTNVVALLRLISRHEDTGEIHEHNVELLESIGAQIGTDVFGNPMTDSPAAADGAPLEIFTDGACNPNPGRGGWGFVAVRDGQSIQECFGGAPRTTNNRMEIKAIIRALLWIPPGTSATIVSDSRLAVKILSGDWRAKANRDLTEEALALIRDRQIELRWVRAHAGDHWNERADALAARGMAEVARMTGGGRVRGRNRSDEKRLIAGFVKALKDHPEAGAIAGIVGPTPDGQGLLCEVNSLNLTGPRLAMLIMRLLETASQWTREEGNADLALMLETAHSCFDLITVDIRTRH